MRDARVGQDQGRLRRTSAVAALLVTHAVLLAYSATQNSPVRDEVGQLPAGISHWTYGRYELYRVNPPLMRMVAALPSLAVGYKEDWHSFDSDLHARPEFAVGRDFVRANGSDWFRLYLLGRWACIPFCLLGAVVCYRWALELWGPPAGFVSLALWCFCPNILGHGQLIMTDAAAAAMGASAAYTFWRWLERPTWPRAALAGCALALAELTKTTWIVLVLIWPLIWVFSVLARRGRRSTNDEAAQRRPWIEAGQMATVFAIALFALNLVYGFRGTLRPLGRYHFVSGTLSGVAAPAPIPAGPATGVQPAPSGEGNRFRSTLLGALPVPLPAAYVQGIDLQRRDFERLHPAFLAGHWKMGGWWYYYLWALLVKLPIATLCLVVTAAAAALCTKAYRADWCSECCLVLPPLAVLLLASSQTALHSHFRYVLPVLPFVYVSVSRVGRALTLGHRALGIFVIVSVVAAIAGGLRNYPHTLSFANVLFGGPSGGARQLAGSNIDWGQDMFALRRWSEAHPHARPLYVACDHILDPAAFAIAADELPPAAATRPPAGWYAISTNELHAESGRYRWFFGQKPIDRAGGSIYLYRVPGGPITVK